MRTRVFKSEVKVVVSLVVAGAFGMPALIWGLFHDGGSLAEFYRTTFREVVTFGSDWFA
jgi:hypothetical protein